MFNNNYKCEQNYLFFFYFHPTSNNNENKFSHNGLKKDKLFTWGFHYFKSLCTFLPQGEFESNTNYFHIIIMCLLLFSIFVFFFYQKKRTNFDDEEMNVGKSMIMMKG